MANQPPGLVSFVSSNVSITHKSTVTLRMSHMWKSKPVLKRCPGQQLLYSALLCSNVGNLNPETFGPHPRFRFSSFSAPLVPSIPPPFPSSSSRPAIARVCLPVAARPRDRGSRLGVAALGCPHGHRSLRHTAVSEAAGGHHGSGGQ